MAASSPEKVSTTSDGTALTTVTCGTRLAPAAAVGRQAGAGAAAEAGCTQRARQPRYPQASAHRRPPHGAWQTRSTAQQRSRQHSMQRRALLPAPKGSSSQLTPTASSCAGVARRNCTANAVLTVTVSAAREGIEAANINICGAWRKQAASARGPERRRRVGGRTLRLYRRHRLLPSLAPHLPHSLYENRGRVNSSPCAAQSGRHTAASSRARATLSATADRLSGILWSHEGCAEALVVRFVVQRGLKALALSAAQPPLDGQPCRPDVAGMRQWCLL